MTEKRVALVIDGTAQGFVAAAGQAEAASLRLLEQQEMQRLAQQRLTMSTAQYHQAMRQLPMQITDVVTSLASGMPVWMVAIQQGGQIRDSFGGVGAAFRAVLGSISPVAAGLGTVAAAGVAVTVAFEQGRREVEAYQKAIVMTGNAAGVTAGQLDEMARRADQARFGTTQGQAADVLAQITSAGGVSRGQIDEAMQVALGLQRELGIEVEKTVQAYAALGRDPLQAAIKLNEQANFLTLETYEQIKALTEQKRFAEAAALAQQTYSEKTLDRLKDVEGELGYLDRTWRAVSSSAREAWDWMRGVGRQDTPEARLAEVQADLATTLANQASARSDNRVRYQPRIDDLRQQEQALREVMRLRQMSADREALQAAAVREQIQADKDAPKDRPTGRPRSRPSPEEFGPPSDLAWRPAQPRFMAGAFEADEIDMRERAKAWEEHRQQLVNTAMATAQQLREQNDMEAAYAITSAQARGLAIIAVEEAQMRSRVDMAVLTSEQKQQVEEEFARWRVARERRLTEELKPEWQRMVEGWADSTKLMQQVFDETVGGSLRIGENAFVSFVRTGKLSIKELTDYLIEQSIRLAFRNFVGGAFGFFSGGGGGGGGYTGFEFGNDPGQRASGGDVKRRRSYWVGENGPELLQMGDEGGWITSNERIRAAVGAGGGGGGIVGVRIVNQDGPPMRVASANVDSSGQLEVLLMAVEDYMADRVSSGTGSFPAALGGAYGLRRSFGSA